MTNNLNEDIKRILDSFDSRNYISYTSIDDIASDKDIIKFIFDSFIKDKVGGAANDNEYHDLEAYIYDEIAKYYNGFNKEYIEDNYDELFVRIVLKTVGLIEETEEEFNLTELGSSYINIYQYCYKV